MKHFFITLLMCSLFVGVGAFAQGTTKTDTLHVSGNCGTCKKKIESPFKHTDGVQSATWDKSTKLFIVEYDPTKITLDKIKEMIVAQGYDTEDLKASDEAYAKLPKCCRYRSGPHGE